MRKGVQCLYREGQRSQFSRNRGSNEWRARRGRRARINHSSEPAIRITSIIHPRKTVAFTSSLTPFVERCYSGWKMGTMGGGPFHSFRPAELYPRDAGRTKVEEGRSALARETKTISGGPPRFPGSKWPHYLPESRVRCVLWIPRSIQIDRINIEMDGPHPPAH